MSHYVKIPCLVKSTIVSGLCKNVTRHEHSMSRGIPRCVVDISRLVEFYDMSGVDISRLVELHDSS